MKQAYFITCIISGIALNTFPRMAHIEDWYVFMTFDAGSFVILTLGMLFLKMSNISRTVAEFLFIITIQNFIDEACKVAEAVGKYEYYITTIMLVVAIWRGIRRWKNQRQQPLRGK